MDSKGQMISSEKGEAEKQRTPTSSPPTPSNHFPIYLHFLTCGDSHGFYYVIEEKGESPAPQYRRPRVEASDAEEDVEYAPPLLNLNQDEEVEDEDEDDEDNDDDPVREAEEEAKGEALYYGVPKYTPSARPFDSDSEEELLPPKKKKSKVKPLEDQSGQIRTENYSRKMKEGEIFVIYSSETDTIRPLQFPDLPFVPYQSDLLLVGERFYLIGGYDAPKSQYGFEDDFPPLTNMFCWDSDAGKVWKSLPGPNVISFNDHYPPRKAAVWAAGTFFVMGHSINHLIPTFRGLSSGDTAWKKLPRLPAIYMSSISTINPLAVNGSKIFFQVGGHVFISNRKYRNHPVHLAAYFDVKSWQWEIVGMWFTGVWSPGVVLYDSYLFSYGRTKLSPKKSYICVYSIERQCWLRRPVRGLKRDGNVLPDDREECGGVAAYLFQVNDDVLSFVWSSVPDISLKEEKEVSDVHCTKFILHCIKDPRKKHPVFRAEVISYGNWLVEGYELQNCLLKRHECDNC